MSLHEWLEWKGWTDQRMADAMGDVSREAVRLWRRGSRMPNVDNARRIRAVTRGRVTAKDMQLAYDKWKGVR